MASITSLPEELVLHIWDYLGLLDEPPPSVVGFDNEPRYTLTKCSSTPIKDLTRVCKRWRNLLLPTLFSHSCVALSPIPRWAGLTRRFLQRCEERHLTSNPQASTRELELIQKMRKLFWSRAPHDNTVDTIAYVGKDKLLLQMGHEWLFWTPSACGEINEYLDFVRRNSLEAAVKSFTLSSSRAFEEVGTVYTCAALECAALWKALFATISPLRLVIAAHPSVMALLTDSRLGAHDDWLFKQDLHYLEFTRPGEEAPHDANNASKTNDTVEQSSSNKNGKLLPARFQPALYNIRDWTHLSYNEGSSIPGYKQYEYFHYSAPSVLPYLLLWMSKEQERRPDATRLQSIRYVACFPFADHMSAVLDALASMRQLATVEISLAPRASSDLLDEAMRNRSDPKDCWQEWRQCYRSVVRYLTRADQGAAVDIAEYWNDELASDLDKLLQETQLVVRKGHRWERR